MVKNNLLDFNGNLYNAQWNYIFNKIIKII